MTLEGMVPFLLLVVEQFGQPMLALLVGLAVAAVAMARLLVGRGRLARRGGSRRLLHRSAALDDLIKFAAIKPDATALRTIIYLDSLAVAHRQRHAADRAWHGGDFVVGTHRSGPFGCCS